MSDEHLTEGSEAPAPETIEPAPVEEPTAEETPKRRRSPRQRRVATIRNRTRRVVVAMDANGDGIHLFPSVDHEIDYDLVGRDIRSKARNGLIDLD